MVDTSVAMQNRHTFSLSLFAVASIHAVIRAIVPLAGEHIETLWWQRKRLELWSVPAVTCKTGA